MRTFRAAPAQFLGQILPAKHARWRLSVRGLRCTVPVVVLISMRVQPGSSKSPEICYASNVHVVVLQRDPESWHTASMNPCQPVTECMCVVFRWICFFFWTFGSLGYPKISKTSPPKAHSSTAWQGLIQHVCEQSRSIKKSAWT